MERRRSRSIQVGSMTIGAGAPIVVQSMLSTDTRDLAASMEQLQRLVDAGCELVRVAVPHADALDGFGELVARSPAAIIADIHFDYKLALGALQRGAAKLRINPGNMARMADVDAVIEAAGQAGVPIRIGVNAGSLAKAYKERSDMTLAEKLVESALSYAEHFEGRGFTDIALSVKASSVPVTVAAYRALAVRCDYPLHIGVTEAGTYERGTVKSAVGLGILLSEGIGDTLRVSLTADPVEEVGVAWRILEALDLRRHGPELISCPTCGRCEIDLFSIVAEVEERLKGVGSDVKVAVMGCVVNGPGEAREADFGIAGGRGLGMLFAKGETVRKVPEEELVDALFEEIESLSSISIT
ncbi:MAG: flavodoxin-dependent (E)-4-hydroxy-3-methylbut-2-enyl-diphosphate synthase [Actinomycetia bacterium]|nr:flavodoxin-dependent (E)-4-hydroxy-3-methylbut-2-enyl-diphosphate synthase [Actinomycetes bacterium]